MLTDKWNDVPLILVQLMLEWICWYMTSQCPSMFDIVSMLTGGMTIRWECVWVYCVIQRIVTTDTTEFDVKPCSHVTSASAFASNFKNTFVENIDGVHTYICILQNAMAKIKEKFKRRRYVWMDLFCVNKAWFFVTPTEIAAVFTGHMSVVWVTKI